MTFDGNISGPEEYWHLEFQPEIHRSKSEWLEAIDQVLHDSVCAHLVADVPYGAFLSGGVDSSAIVAYMAQILQKPVKTFSIGFEENDYNELKYAEYAAKHWGLNIMLKSSNRMLWQFCLNWYNIMVSRLATVQRSHSMYARWRGVLFQWYSPAMVEMNCLQDTISIVPG